MQEVFGWLVQRFGPEVQAWIDDVPALAARLADRWDLRLGEMFAGGASSVVYRCDDPDGTPAVLKLSPDRELTGAQADMLRMFAASNRVPAVLAADADLGALVLEEIRPGTLAEDLPQDTLPDRWAALLTALHATPVPAGFDRTLRGRCDEFFARIGRRLTEPLIARHIDAALWQRAMGRCHHLLDTETNPVMLHGDLHPGNVLDGGPRGLVAIDPKACVGDPCFDAFDLVVAGAGMEGVPARCERVARACGLDGDRLFAWSQVNAVLAAIGHLGDGPGPVVDELLAVARR